MLDKITKIFHGSNDRHISVKVYLRLIIDVADFIYDEIELILQWQGLIIHIQI